MAGRYALMVHPTFGRMNVPEVKIQAYLEAGYTVIERFGSEEPEIKVYKAAPKEEPEEEPKEEPKAKAKRKK